MEPSFFSNQSKKYILLFPLAILIGAVIINGFGVDRLSQWGIFDERMALYSKEADYKFLTIFEYVIKKRGLHIFIVFLACFSVFREKMFFILIGWFGITVGMILGSLYMIFGFKGILVFVICMLCYLVLYAFGIGIMVYISADTKKRVSMSGYGIVLLIILAGIVVESAANWRVFPYIMGIMS